MLWLWKSECYWKSPIVLCIKSGHWDCPVYCNQIPSKWRNPAAINRSLEAAPHSCAPTTQSQNIHTQSVLAGGPTNYELSQTRCPEREGGRLKDRRRGKGQEFHLNSHTQYNYHVQVLLTQHVDKSCGGVEYCSLCVCVCADMTSRLWEGWRGGRGRWVVICSATPNRLYSYYQFPSTQQNSSQSFSFPPTLSLCACGSLYSNMCC